ncbi:MAG TPA: hypothetical protein VLE89_07415, partial [Chlamydiales bacterium]|nr:hypothetical protein [Chlamydiales bacterium]
MIAVSPKHAERGFQLYEQQRPVDTVSKMRLLAYGEDYHFYFRVWIPPDAGQVEAPNFNFIETTLPVDGKSVRLAIDCQDLIKRLQILADANIVTYAAAQKACLENRFTKFIESIERPLRWKQHLTQIVSKEEVLCLLDFLHSHLPTWQQGTLIPRSESKMLYDFEYGKDGSISIHYTRQQDVEIQLLVMNLDSGETFQFEEIDDKVRSFVGLFNESEGIVQFFEILQMGRSFFAKIPLCDGSLETIRLNFPLSRKIKIARQLASGLAVMEEKQIVHCGIFPSAVL